MCKSCQRVDSGCVCPCHSKPLCLQTSGLVSCRPSVRRPLRDRCRQVHLCPHVIPTSDASSRASARKRPFESGSHNPVRRSGYVVVYPRTSQSQRCTAKSHKDFNLDFYTEVQDLSYLENALSSAAPRYAALNMAMCSLIEDYGLVGFETLAVEVRRYPHHSHNFPFLIYYLSLRTKSQCFT